MDLENEIAALEAYVRQMADHIETRRNLAGVLQGYVAKLLIEDRVNVDEIRSFIDRGMSLSFSIAEKLREVGNAR